MESTSQFKLNLSDSLFFILATIKNNNEDAIKVMEEKKVGTFISLSRSNKPTTNLCSKKAVLTVNDNTNSTKTQITKNLVNDFIFTLKNKLTKNFSVVLRGTGEIGKLCNDGIFKILFSSNVNKTFFLAYSRN